MNRILNLSSKHDVKTNYDKIVEIVETFFKSELDAGGNFRFYPNPPKMPDKQVIALSLCAEAMGIDSENNFLYKLRTDYRDDFPATHVTRYNKRRKALAGKTSELAGHMGGELSFGEDVFIVDSMPLPVRRPSREHRTKICRENF